jgi:hypothetical protein
MRLALALCVALVAAPAHAASQSVDPSGGWRTLHTAHFRVHFRPAYRGTATEAAAEAERAYALLAARLHPPRGTIDITLADGSDVPNGFASVSPSNRLVIFLAPPATDPALQRYDSWLRFVIVHELTHLFHLDRIGGLWRALQTVFGRAPGLFPNSYQPSWVREGLATYYESVLTAGGRVGGGFHEPILAAESAAGGGRTRANALMFTRWPGGATPYAYGGAFFSHLARTRGDSVVPRFVEATGKQLIPFRVGRQLRRTGATSRLDETWAQAITAAIGEANAPEPVSRETLLLRDLWLDPSPRISPDGQRLAYLGQNGTDATRLVIADAATLVTIRSRQVNSFVTFDWSGDTLVVAQLEFIDRWRPRSDLYHWLPGGKWRRETRGARIAEPRAGGGMTTWITLGAGETRPNMLRGSASLGDWGEVVPSPDGRWMAGTRNRSGRWTLVRWPTEDAEAMEILFDGGGNIVADPVWDRHGNLYYVWAAETIPQIYRRNGDEVTAVTAAPFGARSPAPLPDGGLLYSTFRDGGWALVRSAMLEAPLTKSRGVTTAPADTVPFEAAAPVNGRETGYAALPSLLPRFWLPFLRDAGPAGFFVGGAISGVDALGRYGYGGSISYSGAPSRLGGAFAFSSYVLGQPRIDAGVTGAWSFAGVTDSGQNVSAFETDAYLGLTIDTRRWRSGASLRVAAEYEGVRYTIEPDSMGPVFDLVGGSATAGLSYVVAAPLAISPQQGFQSSLTYRRRNAQGSTRWSDEWHARITLYVTLPDLGTFAHPVLMVRAAGGVSQGPLRERFEAGGVPSAGFNYLTGGLVGSGRGGLYVRGYRPRARRGERALAAGAELRIPLALIGRSLGALPLGVDKFSLSLFTDAGDAWSAGEHGRLTSLFSAGAELVGDVTFNYDSHLRMRLGVAQPLERQGGDGPTAYLALGTPF